MSKIDQLWLKSDDASSIFRCIKNKEKLKVFGHLEKPALSSPYSQYEEANFKILLLGSQFCGKTSIIESLCSIESSNFYNKIENGDYIETPGIQITHIYWPIKMMNSEKFMMFNLGFWDVGKLAYVKYDYIHSSCFENLDFILFVFSWTDKQSFIEVFDLVKTYYTSSDEKKIDKLIIGTKFDKALHSDIELELIEELENMAQTKIIRFSSIHTSFDQISFLMNKLSENLWKQRFQKQ